MLQQYRRILAFFMQAALFCALLGQPLHVYSSGHSHASRSAHSQEKELKAKDTAVHASNQCSICDFQLASADFFIPYFSVEAIFMPSTQLRTCYKDAPLSNMQGQMPLRAPPVC